MSFDPTDAALLVASIVSGFIMVGIAAFDLFDVSFGATALTLGGFSLSTAYLINAGSLAGTVVTNDNAELDSLLDDAKNIGQYYYYSVVATGALLVAWVVFPEVASFFQSSDLWGLVYVGIMTTGQVTIGWLL